jgi:pSer/pThr/pTyr-binding forkhead associated (FHA) protein
MFAKLVSNGSLCQGQEFAIEQFPFVFGRSANVSLQLDDRWVSRRHCQIETIDGQLKVRDLNSTHGTLVNDRPIAEATLQAGDRLTIGLTSFRVFYLCDDDSNSEVQQHVVSETQLSTAS